MALFNRDYDRNYGYRGGGRTDYGANYGMRGHERGMNSTYNRGAMGAGGYGNRGTGYDRDLGYSTTGGYGADYAGRGATGGYDRPYWGYDTWRYDRNYKSREQTDRGDPFGDRQSGTPIRVMDEPRDRGGWFGGGSDYDRDMRYGRDYRGERGYGAGRTGYGNDYYAANPVGYDPYQTRGGGPRMGRTYDAGYRGRGYDRDWF